MRAVDITVVLIALQLSLGFIGAIGIFDETYYTAPNNTYTNYKITDLDDGLTLEPSLLNQGKMAVEFLWEGAFFIFKILGAVVLIYPTLVNEFNIPGDISAMLQGIIYFVYYLGYYQWKTGKSVGNYV